MPGGTLRPTLLIALLACSSPEGGDRPATGSTTPSSVPTDDLEVICTAQPGNFLRVDCTVRTEPPAALELTLQERIEDGPDGRTRTQTADEVAAEHRITWSGLAPESTYAWSVDNGSLNTVGSFTTGPPPADFPELAASGTASAPYVLFALGTTAYIAETAGRIVWFEEGAAPDPTAPQGGRVSGVAWTGEGVAWHQGSVLRHTALDGSELLRLERGTDFERPLHGDVAWQDGRIWSLNAGLLSTVEADFVSDGLYVFDETGLLGSWDLGSSLADDPAPTGTPSTAWAAEYPGAEDLGQATALELADDGTAILTLRGFDAVWALEGVDSPDFGALRWTLDGDGSGDLSPTVSAGLTDPPGFVGPAHARLVGDRLSLLDTGDGTDARGLVYALDPGAGAAEVVVSHRLGRPCDRLGGAYELEGGAQLLTCSASRELFEYAAGTPEDIDPHWVLEVDGTGLPIPRGIPIPEAPPSW